MRPRIIPIAFLAAASIYLGACGHIAPAPADPLQPDEHLSLAHIYETKGETDLALSEYLKALQSEKGASDAHTHFAIANIYLNKKMYLKAEERYKKAIELRPSEGPYYNNLAWAYMEDGKMDKAESAAYDALSKDPDRGYIYLDTLGVIKMRMRRYTEAESDLKKAASLAERRDQKGLWHIYNHLLELYELEGDTEAATAIEEDIRRFDR